MKRPLIVVGGVATFALLATACGSNSPATNHDQGIAQNQLQTYQQNGQEVHQYNRSQYRATLQDVEDYQAHGVATTTFDITAQGQLIFSCPSIGEPVHATDSLTNPQQIQWGSNGGNGVISQMENTGVYPGESSGTYTLCVRPDGTTFINYDEGNVETVGAPAHWDPAAKAIVVDGNAPAGAQPTVVH